MSNAFDIANVKKYGNAIQQAAVYTSFSTTVSTSKVEILAANIFGVQPNSTFYVEIYAPLYSGGLYRYDLLYIEAKSTGGDWVEVGRSPFMGMYSSISNWFGNEMAYFEFQAPDVNADTLDLRLMANSNSSTTFSGNAIGTGDDPSLPYAYFGHWHITEFGARS